MSRTALATIPATLQVVTPRRKSAPAQSQKLSYSPAEAAEALGLSVFTVRRLVGRGELQAAKIGARVVILRQSLLDLLEDGKRRLENSV